MSSCRSVDMIDDFRELLRARLHRTRAVKETQSSSSSSSSSSCRRPAFSSIVASVRSLDTFSRRIRRGERERKGRRRRRRNSEGKIARDGLRAADAPRKQTNARYCGVQITYAITNRLSPPKAIRQDVTADKQTSKAANLVDNIGEERGSARARARTEMRHRAKVSPHRK